MAGATGRATWLTVLCASIFGLAAVPTAAEACMCFMAPDNCHDLAAASAVFEATVEFTQLGSRSASSAAALPTEAASSTLLSGDVVIATLRDVKRLRGAASSIVITASDDSACGYTFHAGTRYLIVATRLPGGQLAVTKCGLTRPLSDRDELLDYIRTLDGPPAQTRMWGAIMMPVRWVDFSQDFGPVPAARVTVTGPATRSVTTGPDGRYVFADLPHGLYTVNVELPRALPQLDPIPPWSFTLDNDTAHACVVSGAVAPVRSAISGVIVDDDARPLSGVFVQLGLADQLDRSRGSAGAGTQSDADGRYRFEHLPPGRYLVGLNIWGRGPNPSSPFAETYAGTTAGETAIPLAFGGSVTLDPIRARRLTHITVQGTVREPAGSPARSVDVTAEMLRDDGRPYPADQGKTDADGRLQLRLWLGERYRVTVGSPYGPDAQLEFIAADKPLSITLRGR